MKPWKNRTQSVCISRVLLCDFYLLKICGYLGVVAYDMAVRLIKSGVEVCTMNNTVNVLENFLPSGSKVLDLQHPTVRPAVLLADIDGDRIDELIGAYKYQEEIYILVLKKMNGQWRPVGNLKSSGDVILNLHSVQLANAKRNALVIEWQLPGRESQVDMLQWTNHGFVRNQAGQMDNSKNPGNEAVIASQKGDVTGDGAIDTVYLTGNKTEDSPFWQNITLVIQDGKNNVREKFQLKENMGYNPTLFLGDFTGNHVEDILVVMDTGGSGGTIYAYVFAFLDGKMRQVFDVDAFNERYQYGVNYENDFKAIVTSQTPQKKYTLDLTYKGEEYLSEIYNPDGTLKEPIEGWINPLGGLYPIDFDRDGTYELEAVQGIAGRYNADGLGYMQNVLKWNGHEFAPDRQSVAIFGEDVTST